MDCLILSGSGLLAKVVLKMTETERFESAGFYNFQPMKIMERLLQLLAEQEGENVKITLTPHKEEGTA